jgi:hypothetical protein
LEETGSLEDAGPLADSLVHATLVEQANPANARPVFAKATGVAGASG